MIMGFTKLDEKILQSSVMAEPSTTFKVWIALLASCREDGISPVSSIYLASVCHLPASAIDKAIMTLESPDLRSRSTNDDGRRIRRVDGGYYVINYLKYRDYSYSSNPESVRKREYRDKLGHVPKSPGHSASVSASSSASSSYEKEFAQFWESYPEKKQKQDALKAFTVLRRSVPLEEIAKAFNGYMDFLKAKRVKENFEQKPMYPATFLRNDRWRDYIDFKYQAKL